MDLKEEEILMNLVSDHWYYRSKADAMFCFLGNFIPKKILDIGAGSGFFSKQLLKQPTTSKAICVDINYQIKRDEIFAKKKIQFRKRYGSIDADLVLLMDVLEHVDDEIGLLKEQISKVPPGTRFLITVPAFAFLWSAHDVFLGHKRRYSLNKLECLVHAAGLSIERSAYFFAFIFPLVAVVRLFSKWRNDSNDVAKSDLQKHSKFTNEVVSFICRLELPLFPYNRLAGLSVFCLSKTIDAKQEVSSTVEINENA